MKEITIPPDALARFRVAAAEFARNPKSRASRLEAVRDDIVAMRAKGASFRTISELLSRSGIHASDTCVMRFCQNVLGEQPVRARKAKSRTAVHRNGSAASQAAPDATGNAMPNINSSAKVTATLSAAPAITEAAQVALLDDLLSCPPPGAEKQQGGPRIAKIQFANSNKP